MERQKKISEKILYISCIVPVFNEAAGIRQFLTELITTLQSITNCFEIIVVDDGSNDETIETIKAIKPHDGIKIIGLSRHFGKEIALTAGLENAKGEVAILLDADFQHPLELIHEFVQQWGLGYEMVYGIRQSREAESYVKRNAAKSFYWLMRRMTKIEMPNNACDFRLLDRKIIDALSQFPERSRFMKGLYAWVGFKKRGLTFEVKERSTGKSAWHFRNLTELALTGITSFSDIPLRIWGFIGFIISFISLLYAIYIVTVTLLFGADKPGFPTIVVAIVFLGGIQLLSIGILGEYIARIFTEVKQRPKYLIQTKHGFD